MISSTELKFIWRLFMLLLLCILCVCVAYKISFETNQYYIPKNNRKEYVEYQNKTQSFNHLALDVHFGYNQ